jgi:hypothetical protein
MAQRFTVSLPAVLARPAPSRLALRRRASPCVVASRPAPSRLSFSRPILPRCRPGSPSLASSRAVGYSFLVSLIATFASSEALRPRYRTVSDPSKAFSRNLYSGRSSMWSLDARGPKALSLPMSSGSGTFEIPTHCVMLPESHAPGKGNGSHKARRAARSSGLAWPCAAQSTECAAPFTCNGSTPAALPGRVPTAHYLRNTVISAFAPCSSPQPSKWPSSRAPSQT